MTIRGHVFVCQDFASFYDCSIWNCPDNVGFFFPFHCSIMMKKDVSKIFLFINLSFLLENLPVFSDCLLTFVPPPPLPPHFSGPLLEISPLSESLLTFAPPFSGPLLEFLKSKYIDRGIEINQYKVELRCVCQGS